VFLPRRIHNVLMNCPKTSFFPHSYHFHPRRTLIFKFSHPHSHSHSNPHTHTHSHPHSHSHPPLRLRSGFTIHYPLSTLNSQLSTLHSPLFTIHYSLFTLHSQLSPSASIKIHLLKTKSLPHLDFVRKPHQFVEDSFSRLV